MFSHLFNRITASTLPVVLLFASLVVAQDSQATLRITPQGSTEKLNQRNPRVANLDRKAAFHRINPSATAAARSRSRTVTRRDSTQWSWLSRRPTALDTPSVLSLGIGSGDIDEAEPNDSVAQAVSLPVNVFGEMDLTRDVDFFAFQAIAGQQVTLEAFATRIRSSELVADIAIFDAAGQILASKQGNEDEDPVLRFTPLVDQILIVGISDVDELGGQFFDYILNITRGSDIDEQEPNGRNAQALAGLPVTVFGSIDTSEDVDFYSLNASAGQTLIVDVDAEVLGSRLDAEINVMDPVTGVEFFYNDQSDGDDPRFNIVLPYAGRFVIGIGAFSGGRTGTYRLNASLLSASGAPIVNGVERLAKKKIQVSGAGFAPGSVVEVNGTIRATTIIDTQTLLAKVKTKSGQIVTVLNSTDGRRSNPLIVP